MHGLFVDATPLIVPLHVIGVILFVFILQTQSEWACIWLNKSAQHSNTLNIEYVVILWVSSHIIDEALTSLVYLAIFDTFLNCGVSQ